jgi:alkylation response protein AidB-like acyl-CoA dehydrogenase
MKNAYLALPGNLTEKLRQDAFIAENEGRLSYEQLKIIYDRQWFNLFVPTEYGGLALSLPDAVRLEEKIAYADGSVGWVVTLCSGAAMFIGYFDKEIAREVFSDQRVCLAGSGKPNGVARKTASGFELSGEWPYASGAPHATYFTANCRIGDSEEIQSFLLKRNEVMLMEDWDFIGLKATAGYSFSVKNLKIPASRMFSISADHVQLNDPVYQYPFLPFAEATIAVNMCGMCLCFFALAEQLLSGRKSVTAEAALKNEKAFELINTGTVKISLLRHDFYAALDSSWLCHVSGKSFTDSGLRSVSETSKALARQARLLVNELYGYCGMDAARNTSMINLVWRNINTASQHTLL